MCEFLVYAKVQWMEEVPQEVKDKWDDKMWDKYNRRLVKGNPIVVKPDGWKWGKEERPPIFVVVKVPDMTVEEGVKYLESAVDYTKEPDVETKEYPMLYRKKWKFDVNDVESALISKESIATTKSVFESKLENREPPKE